MTEKEWESKYARLRAAAERYLVASERQLVDGAYTREIIEETEASQQALAAELDRD